jgi:hypothetical protein
MLSFMGVSEVPSESTASSGRSAHPSSVAGLSPMKGGRDEATQAVPRAPKGADGPGGGRGAGGQARLPW